MSYAHKWQPMFALTRHAPSVHLFLYFYSFYSFFWLRFAFRPKFLNYLLVVLFVPDCDVFLFFFFLFFLGYFGNPAVLCLRTALGQLMVSTPQGMGPPAAVAALCRRCRDCETSIGRK